MARTAHSEDRHLRGTIANALRTLARRDTRNEPVSGTTPVISAFVTRTRETIAQLVMPMAGLIIVIEGRKDIIAGAGHRLYEAGDAFVLPAHARFDVVNEPDSETGFYRALFVGFPRELVIEAARRWPQFVGQHGPALEPVINASLCSAILHGAEALSHGASVSRRVVEHRILEILLILAEQGVLPLVPKYVDGSVVEGVRLLVRHRLHLPWTAGSVAAELSMSEATLRRRLRAEDETLQELLRAERMKAAYIVLHERDADVADALAATGYRSRSHFARHFQKQFGTTPSLVRRSKQATVS